MLEGKENKNTVFVIIIVVLAVILGFLVGTLATSKSNSMNQTQNVNVNSTENTADKININTATKKELKTLPGIGEVKAKRIIKNRPFVSVSQLLNCMGKDEYNAIKDKVVTK